MQINGSPFGNSVDVQEKWRCIESMISKTCPMDRKQSPRSMIEATSECPDRGTFSLDCAIEAYVDARIGLQQSGD
jgi:hypothetical protein